MATLEGLRGQIARLREMIPLNADPRHWVLELYTGEEIPAAIRARIGPNDMVVIREIDPAWRAIEGPCIGTVQALTGKGPVEILYREGYSGETPVV